MSFEQMDAEQLFEVAIEDFALEVEATDNKKALLAAFTEAGITWDMYLLQHPELAEDEAVTEAPTLVVEEEEEMVLVPKSSLRTATSPLETVQVGVPDMYLVKMDPNVRQNPYFEYGPYRFTDKHPFVPMPAADADYLLRTEKGFNIAQPSEAAEYYDVRK